MVCKRLGKAAITRWTVFAVCELFCLISLAYFAFFAYSGFSKVAVCLVSALCLCAPTLAEKIFKFRVPTPVYVFVLLYAVCPTLGHAYKFYYLIEWWDLLLHVTGGVVFALLGAYLPTLFGKKEGENVLLCAAFGFLFSVFVSVAWEFVEYFSDIVFLSDMQQDTWVIDIRSYLLGSGAGVKGSIEGIESVVVNGKPLQGYLDIGLIDTMTDMLVETLGALAYAVIYLVDKGKYSGLKRIKPVCENVEENTEILEKVIEKRSKKD